MTSCGAAQWRFPHCWGSQEEEWGATGALSSWLTHRQEASWSKMRQNRIPGLGTVSLHPGPLALTGLLLFSFAGERKPGSTQPRPETTGAKPNPASNLQAAAQPPELRCLVESLGGRDTLHTPTHSGRQPLGPPGGCILDAGLGAAQSREKRVPQCPGRVEIDQSMGGQAQRTWCWPAPTQGT